MAIIGLLNNQDSWLSNEIDILSDLTDENIQATGQDLRYMPREQVNPDRIFGEATVANIKEGFVIEMRLENISNFNGDGDMFSKFGLTHTDDATLMVSTRRFAAEGRKFGLQQPLEGDLIYMPFSNTMWTIKKVKHDPNYYQFGANRVWRLECNLYTPTHEKFEGGTIAPTDLGETATPRDESSLNMLLGIPEDSKQDDSAEFDIETTEETIPNEFNSDNPFGD